MAAIKCKCGNTYFARVLVNQFQDHPASLHSPMREVEPDHDIRLYQCLLCKSYMMPPMNYFNSTEEDKELYAILQAALEGKVLEKKTKHKPKRVHSGTVSFVGGDREDAPESHGKFIPASQ